MFTFKVMKKVIYLVPIAVLFLCTSARAQQVNIDSLTLIAQIAQDQLDLGKLQNMVHQKTANKNGAAFNAQTSADDNAAAAQRLSEDPTNKKLASNASDKAGDAKSDARKSRRQSGKLDDLNKEIVNLKLKIAGEQSKLNVYSSQMVAAPAATVTPAVSDTTAHP